MGVCIWTLENKYIISENGKCCEEKVQGKWKGVKSGDLAEKSGI